MSRICRVGVHTYRQHRIELFDDGACGWRAIIHAQAGRGAVADLHTPIPKALGALVADAKRRVDGLMEVPTLPGCVAELPAR